MKKEKLLLFLIGIILLIFLPIISAQPTINFSLPTPSNGTTADSDSIYVNLTTNSSLDHYSFVDFNEDVALWMKMDEISQVDGVGATVYDNSSQGNHGTATGNANQTPNGKFGKGYVFDGDNDYIGFASNNNLQFTKTFTLSAWIKPTSWLDSYGDGMAVARRQNNYFLDVNYGNFRFFVYGLSPAQFSYSGYNLNEWIHLVGTFDYQDSIKLYINGIEKKSVPMSGTEADYMNNQPLKIGSQQTSSDYFNGTIDDVIIFGRTLAPAEISSLYNASANQYYNNFTSLSNQTHEFIGYSVDTDGDLNQTETWEVTVPDLTAPNINITTPSNDTNSSNTNLNVNYTSSDDNLDACWYSNDSYAMNYTLDGATCSNLTNATWAEGNHNVTVWINDTANNVNQSSVTFNIDTTYPVINITNPTNNSNLSSATFNLNYTFTELNPDSCWYSNDSGEANSSIVSVGTNWTDLTGAEGDINRTIYCNDSANNINSSVIFFTIDTIYPQINITNPPNLTSSQDTTLDINYTSSDTNLDACWYSNDSYTENITLASCANITTVTWIVGQHNLTIWANDTFGNINNSFVRFTIQATATDEESSTDGGGGSGPVTKECEENSDCNEGYSCYSNQCLKLFDVKIIRVDSPIEPEQFFNFTYLVKAMTEIDNDVIIDFWLEKNSEKISSGFDTIYFGSFEEKIEETQLFLPNWVEYGDYSFYVQATYRDYSAKALRTIQVGKVEEEFISSKPASKLIYYLIILILLILIIIILILYIKIKMKSHKSLIKGLGVLAFSLVGVLFLKQNDITGYVIGSGSAKNLLGIFYFVFIIGGLGLLIFIHNKNIKKTIKIKREKGYYILNIKGLINKKVYTSNGDYIGKIKEMFLENYKIKSLKINLSRKFKTKGFILKYKYVTDVGKIVFIDNRIIYKIK